MTVDMLRTAGAPVDTPEADGEPAAEPGRATPRETGPQGTRGGTAREDDAVGLTADVAAG
ncbi:hypothetical protein [Streptomyces sp. 8N706]|uniref:hypothetical protein n=1 Tax=Streptomyces sp. 8N706 TaxID=3457416 RepID=UPI003FD13228